jgi:ubiquinone/menaquinone biosynthesis C-methylase UbiE
MTNAYDLYLYPTKAQPQLHIANLCTTAFLRGYDPAPIATAKVLEVGCGTGLNLLPMAASFPSAEFVGVDLAEHPIRMAKELAARFGLSNVRFHQADINEMADDFGEFDYMIAHGFYSWVPASARDSLWRIARGSLSEHGVIQVSYNTLPGALQMRYLRDFCQLHMRRFADRDTQLKEAWKLVETLAAMKDTDNPLAMAAAQTLAKGFDTAIHDEFAAINDAFYLGEVVTHAAARKLRYVGDAVQKFVLGLQRLPEGEALLATLPQDDRVLLEQYRDFLSYRGFRQSLFAKASQLPSEVSYRDRLTHCYLDSQLRVGPPDEEGNRVFDAPNLHMGFHSQNSLLAELFLAFEASQPIPVPLQDFCEQHEEAFRKEGSEVVDQFWELVEDLARNGLIQVHACPPRVPDSLPERPKMAGIARWEALLGVALTNVFHRGQDVSDPLLRTLAAITDGTRTVPEICSTLSEIVVGYRQGRSPHVVIEGFPIALGESAAVSGSPDFKLPRVEMEQRLLQAVPGELERFRRLGLLVEG